MPSRNTVGTRIGSLVIAAALSLVDTAPAAAQQTLIRQAQVFDGTRMIGVRNVLVIDGKIASIGSSTIAPAGATVVDGEGRTLMPGLIDSHTHVYGDAL